MKILKVLVQVFIVAIPVLVFFWLLQKDITPGGRFAVEYRVDALSPFVDRFLPDARVQAPTAGPDGSYSLVVDEPAYAAVHTPGDFDTLEATLLFQNTDQPIIELGILQNEDPLQYDLQPIQNLLIDGSSWSRIEENGLVFLQREKVYTSIADFLAQPPHRDAIATYHFDLPDAYRIPGYTSQNALTTTEVSLRGYHEITTYIKNEPLLLQADFMDMNREYGEDPVSLLVFNETGEVVAEEMLVDDGMIENTNRGSSLRSLTLVKNDLPEGVYKIILKANRDIFFRRIVTRQRYITFVGSVYLGDEVGYKDSVTPVQFYTSGKHLSFFTYHADAVQRIGIGSGSLNLPEAQTRYDYNVTDDGLVAVSAASGDFTMTQDGLTAFSRDQFFNPYPTRLTSTTDLDALGINFIIARYATPLLENGWLKATATFDLKTAWKKGEDIKLILSAPGIKSLQKSFHIHGLDLMYIRPSLTRAEFWSKVKTFIGL